MGRELFCHYLATMTRFQRKSCENPSWFQLQLSSINHLQRGTCVHSITWVSNLCDNYKITPPGNLKAGWNALVFSKIMTEGSVMEKLFTDKMLKAGCILLLNVYQPYLPLSDRLQRVSGGSF